MRAALSARLPKPRIILRSHIIDHPAHRRLQTARARQATPRIPSHTPRISYHPTSSFTRAPAAPSILPLPVIRPSEKKKTAAPSPSSHEACGALRIYRLCDFLLFEGVFGAIGVVALLEVLRAGVLEVVEVFVRLEAVLGQLDQRHGDV